MKVRRETVDLSAYPDLVVIYLGMQARSLRGVGTILKLGPQIQKAVEAKPDGLLLHENLLFSLVPLHVGMRQYWRSFDELEKWAKLLPHQTWWQNFLKDPGGTGFWHETYFRRGGIEAIYDATGSRIGLSAFAPVVDAHGPLFSARERAERGA